MKTTTNLGNDLNHLIEKTTNRRKEEKERKIRKKQEKERKEQEFQDHMDKVLYEMHQECAREAKKNFPFLQELIKGESLKSFLKESNLTLWVDDRTDPERIVLKSDGVYFTGIKDVRIKIGTNSWGDNEYTTKQQRFFEKITRLSLWADSWNCSSPPKYMWELSECSQEKVIKYIHKEFTLQNRI